MRFTRQGRSLFLVSAILFAPLVPGAVAATIT